MTATCQNGPDESRIRMKQGGTLEDFILCLREKGMPDLT